MSKILIVAEKVNGELLFLKKIREITHESIVTIKSNLAEKKPFYQGFLYGNEHENTERLVFQIIDFTKKNNDIIKLYEIGDDDIFENLMHKKKYEISETTFKNLMGSASETLQVFEMEWVLNVNDREINVESVEKLKELLLNEQEKAKKQPVIAFVNCPDDSALSLGLGRDRSPLTYLPSDDSPSRHAVDDTKGDEEVIDFLLGGEYSEFPLMNTIKTEDAIEACIEFMNTGKISNKLEWQDD